MIKRILLILCVTTYAQAEITPYLYEKELTNLYLETAKSKKDRDKVIETIGAKTFVWYEFTLAHASGKEEGTYIVRIMRMFMEIYAQSKEFKKLEMPRFPLEKELVELYLEKDNMNTDIDELDIIANSFKEWSDKIARLSCKTEIDAIYLMRMTLMFMEIAIANS